MCAVQDLIEQATTLKSKGNAHFTAQRNHDALESYREAIRCLPNRKPKPPRDIKGKDTKGKGRADLSEAEKLESNGDLSSSDEEESTTRRTHRSKPVDAGANGGPSSQIRELGDEEDEEQFLEEGKKSVEERQMEELRSVLWGNLGACQMRLVSQAGLASIGRAYMNTANPERFPQSLYKEAVESCNECMCFAVPPHCCTTTAEPVLQHWPTTLITSSPYIEER